MWGRDSDEYRKGYDEGLHGGHPYPSLTSDYTSMDPRERQDYDDGFRDGRREYWRDDLDLSEDDWC